MVILGSLWASGIILSPFISAYFIAFKGVKAKGKEIEAIFLLAFLWPFLLFIAPIAAAIWSIEWLGKRLEKFYKDNKG